MSTIILVPWSATDWTESQRLPGATALPLNDAGIAQAKEWAAWLTPLAPRFVFTSGERTSKETATQLARSTDAEVKTLKNLQEIDFGLWAGLTEDRVRERFPKVYKRWREDPAAVDPPGGEPIGDVTKRLEKALAAAATKAGRHPYALVIGPAACAIACGIIHGQAITSRRVTEPVVFDLAEVGERGSGPSSAGSNGAAVVE